MTKDKQINVILFNQIVVNSGVEVEMSALPPQHGPGGGGGGGGGGGDSAYERGGDARRKF